MGIYRTIQMSFWTDPKVDDDFTPEDKYFYLYLLTNPHTNICGCYEVSTKQVERETGYSADTIKRLIDRLENVHKVIRYCDDTKEVLVLHWARYNWTKSQKFMKAALSVAKEIKSDNFYNYVFSEINDYTETVTVTENSNSNSNSNRCIHRVSEKEDTVSIPYAYRMDTVSEKKKTWYPYVPDVKAYCQEKHYGNVVNPDVFVSYYQQRGWCSSNGRPIVDWKAAVDYWYSRDKKPEKDYSAPNGESL